ncbi:MAG: hypothetical protein WDN24_09355 [Sphingomonas sp.]
MIHADSHASRHRHVLARRLLIACAAAAPAAGVWIWTTTALGDALAGGVLTGMGLLGAVSLVPHPYRRGG